MKLPFEYDHDANALYYRLSDREILQTLSYGDSVNIDLDEDLHPVGIEVIDPPGIGAFVQDVKRLSMRIQQQRAHLSQLNDVLRRKNIELDALHWVWCDGGCSGGVHRWHPKLLVTRELVETAEVHAERLRSWYNTVNGRYEATRGKNADSWFRKYAERAAARTDVAQEQEREEEWKTLKTSVMTSCSRTPSSRARAGAAIRRFARSMAATSSK